MRQKLALIIYFTCLLSYAQTTENPVVESQRTKHANVTYISTNATSTIVDIDLRSLFVNTLGAWASISSKTSIQYKNPTTGDIVSKPIIMMQKWINGQSKFENAHFDTKYSLVDFGTKNDWPLFRLVFPPIDNGVNTITITENAGRRGFYWNNVKIRQVKYETNFEEAKKKIEEHIAETKSEYAGEYEGVNSWWHLAFLQDENDYVLVNTDSIQPGWSIGDIWANLKATAYQNVFLGTRHVSGGKEQRITVTFEDGIMNIKDGDDMLEFLKISGTTTAKEESHFSEWSGTGFALKDGYIVTNYHVVKNAKTIEIFGVNGIFESGFKANVVGVDKVSDLALLKILDKNIEKTITPPYSFYPSMVDVGENIYVLGYPLTQTMGEEIKLTNGIISSKSGFEGDVTTYQISAPVQPGNSGGPMFDMQGRLVGIICAKHTGAENASYAIKTSYLNNLVESVASSSILPTPTTPMGKELKDQVKMAKPFIYLIKCSDLIGK